MNQDSYLSSSTVGINSKRSALKDAELCPSGDFSSSEERTGLGKAPEHCWAKAGNQAPEHWAKPGNHWAN